VRTAQPQARPEQTVDIAVRESVFLIQIILT